MIPVLIKTALTAPLQMTMRERHSPNSGIAHLHTMTLLQELQAMLEARSASGSGLLKPFDTPAPTLD
jgi:hypothetical protein